MFRSRKIHFTLWLCLCRQRLQTGCHLGTGSKQQDAWPSFFSSGMLGWSLVRAILRFSAVNKQFRIFPRPCMEPAQPRKSIDRNAETILSNKRSQSELDLRISVAASFCPACPVEWKSIKSEVASKKTEVSFNRTRSWSRKSRTSKADPNLFRNLLSILPTQETGTAAALCLHLGLFVGFSCAYIAWRTKHKLKHWQRWKRFRRCKMSSGCRTRGPNNANGCGCGCGGGGGDDDDDDDDDEADDEEDHV